MDKKKVGSGLAITKNLVQLMKGQLGIESEVEKEVNLSLNCHSKYPKKKFSKRHFKR